MVNKGAGLFSLEGTALAVEIGFGDFELEGLDDVELVLEGLRAPMNMASTAKDETTIVTRNTFK